MGIFSWLASIFGFKNNNNNKSVNQSNKSNGVRLGKTELFYHEDLISNLKADHKFLVESYTNIGKARGEKNFPELKKSLDAFTKRLEKHLLTENTLLYVYLTEAVKNDTENLESVKKNETRNE